MLTHLCHSTASFAVMHNGACDVVGCDLRLRGVHAAAEVHNGAAATWPLAARAQKGYTFNDSLRSSLLFDLEGS